MLVSMSKKSWGSSWVVDQLNKSREYKPKSQNYVNEKKLYACPSCNTAWEIYKHQHVEYKDFPKYGLNKETCPKCR